MGKIEGENTEKVVWTLPDNASFKRVKKRLERDYRRAHPKTPKYSLIKDREDFVFKRAFEELQADGVLSIPAGHYDYVRTNRRINPTILLTPEYRNRDRLRRGVKDIVLFTGAIGGVGFIVEKIIDIMQQY